MPTPASPDVTDNPPPPNSDSVQRMVRGTCPKCKGDKLNVHSSQMLTGEVECSKCGHTFTTQPCLENREPLTDRTKVCPSNVRLNDGENQK